MKLHRLLAIYTLLVLNACAGWHDSAPFVAWPATNHLRWVDNVGTYTNASNPTNANYGAWTNNYWATNAWFISTPTNYYLFPLPIAGAVKTNVLLNAKEMRAFDCVYALAERYSVMTNTTSISNFCNQLAFDGTNWYLPRTEVKAIQLMKNYISSITPSYYYTTNDWSSVIPYNYSSLCARANVPTNFLAYTPYRSADGSGAHYQRIMTNTFILEQGTNSTHQATNSLIDSAGVSFTAVGTNGATVTRYATNTSQVTGYDIGVYGWDGLRRVITNLYATRKSVDWGVGIGTNYTDSFTTNYNKYTNPLSFFAGTIGAPPTQSVIEAGCVAANGQTPYSASKADTWEWSLASMFSGPATASFSRTNVGPYAKGTSSYSFGDYVRSEFDSAYTPTPPYDLPSDDWFANFGVFDQFYIKAYAYNVDFCTVPLIYSNPAPIARTVLMTAVTNYYHYVVSSNYLSSSTISCTSAPVYPNTPTNFGFRQLYVTNAGPSGFSMNWEPSIWKLRSFYMNICVEVPNMETNKYPTISYVNHSQSIASNATTVLAGEAVEIWDFEYK